MKTIKFVKMVASGNDFIVTKDAISEGLSKIARSLCDRKFGIGADGLLLLQPSKNADIRMRIFNADGSEAEMCGNGARCAALFAASKNVSIETKAGIIKSLVNVNRIRIRLTDPESIKLDIPVKINNRNLKTNFINTGVPHAVIFIEGLEEMHVGMIGRAVRNHKKFAPRGTNVDFVEVLGKDLIAIRTYERGVEDETLACGTGSVAAALIFSLKGGIGEKIKVLTKSRETLVVYFIKENNRFSNVELEGEAKIVYKGECYV